MTRFRFSEAIFSVFLRAYPRRFREAFAAELMAFFREDRQRAARRGLPATVRMWGRTLIDLLRSAWRQRFSVRRAGAPRSSPPRKDTPMSDLLQDLRYGLRSFALDPAFTAIAVITLALGIGAVTGVFSVIDGVLLRPLPYPDEDRLLYVGSHFRGDDLSVVSEGNLVDLAEQAVALDAVAGSSDVSYTLLGDGEPELIEGVAVGLDFFPMLGVEPALGRGFTAADFAPGAPDVAILEHSFWRRRWNGDAGALGETMMLDGEPALIIGVAPADFVPPEALHGHAAARLWVPLRIPDPPERTELGYQALARLAPDASLAQAAAEIDRIFHAQTELYGLDWEYGGGAALLREQTLGTAAEPLLVLLLGVGALLLIACANVANLMLARGARRGRELTVRRSLGAGGGRILRQLLTESVVLSLAGGACGAVLSYGAVQAFKASSPGGVPRLAEIGVDLRALGVTLLIATGVGLLFGLAPALQALRRDAAGAIRASGARRGSSAAGRSRGFLVVAEVALALVLLIGAALLANSFVRLSNVDTGFDPDDLVGMQVNLRSAYPDRDTWVPFFRDLLAGVQALPGVTSASLTTSLPFAGNAIALQVVPLDTPAGEVAPEYIAATYMSRGHFRNMGMALREGDGFQPRAADAPPQVIVNDAFVAAYWPGNETAVGKRVRMGSDADAPVATVIGVVGALRYRHDREKPPEMYLDMEVQTWRSMWVVARVSTDPTTLVAPLRAAVWSLDPDLPVDRVVPMNTLAWNSVGQPRFYSALAAALAGIALALALVGIYGTLAYAVAGRVREIGVRVALGAEPAGVVALVLRSGLLLTALGIALGTAGAWGVSRLLESFLFGIEPDDAATFAVAVLLFLVTATLACWLPARRAARLDPVQALRSEP